MNKKILDIFLNLVLVAGITFIVLSFFGNDNKNNSSSLSIDFASNSYTVPASPVIAVKNYTNESVVVEPCEDFEIRKNGELMQFSGKICDTVTVPAQSEQNISFADHYNQFEDMGKYTLKASVGEKEFIGDTQINNKGSISKIFSTLIYAPIYNLVVWLMDLFNHSFGWAIVGITIIIRLLLLYPQHKMMVSQRKMQAIQPKMKKIQEKYKDDKQQLGIKVMELYKKEKVSPFSSCGVLLIQMPILLVVYKIILGVQDPANKFYLYDSLKNFDLSKIDFSFLGLDLLQVGGVQGLILALVIAFIQFVQIKLSLSYNKPKEEAKKGVVLEKKKGENAYSQMMPDPEVMNKFMMYGMPLMVGIFTYTLFAGVGLYWGITTLIMLIQQLVVNKIIKK